MNVAHAPTTEHGTPRSSTAHHTDAWCRVVLFSAPVFPSVH